MIYGRHKSHCTCDLICAVVPCILLPVTARAHSSPRGQDQAQGPHWRVHYSQVRTCAVGSHVQEHMHTCTGPLLLWPGRLPIQGSQRQSLKQYGCLKCCSQLLCVHKLCPSALTYTHTHTGPPVTCRKLLDELVALGEPEALVMRALCALDSQGEFQLRRERSVVYRVR
jgi:hypothetical protein